MKSNIKIILSAVLLITALSLVIWKISSNNPPAETPTTDNKSTSKHERPGGENHTTHAGGQGAGTSERPAADPNKGIQSADKEVILEKIQDASITYDAAQLPAIKPHLLSADPEIRKAAVNGMVVLGDASASPMLRDAAKQMNTAEDVKMMLEAAEYLELPSANLSEIIKRNKEKKATAPQAPLRPTPIK